jgi:hypothetical protein
LKLPTANCFSYNPCVKKLLLAAVILVLACGKRGDPKPPVPIIPQATTDLLVTQRADQVILSWSYPSLTTAGRSLTGVERISVYRYDEDLPASAIERDREAGTTAALDPDLPHAVKSFSDIPTIPQAQFMKLSTRIDSIEGANLAAATAGTRLLFTDTPAFTTADGRPVRLTYAVVTETRSTRGAFSNLVTIIPLPVALPPAALTANAKPEGVVLTWTRPEKSIKGNEAPVILGYHVYRTAPGEPVGNLAPPVSGLVKEESWTDTPAYGEYAYQVAAVAATGPPLIQSALSSPASATFRDLVPPAPPASVTVLVEPNLVRLVWEPVNAPDLRGYNVYRIEGPYQLKLTPGPTGEPHFMDISVQPGTTYYYEITSVDQKMNESLPVRSETLIVPKTP